MDRCVFVDGNEWPAAARRFILDERFCHGGHVEGTPRNHYDGERGEGRTILITFLFFFSFLFREKCLRNRAPVVRTAAPLGNKLT